MVFWTARLFTPTMCFNLGQFSFPLAEILLKLTLAASFSSPVSPPVFLSLPVSHSPSPVSPPVSNLALNHISLSLLPTGQQDTAEDQDPLNPKPLPGLSASRSWAS